MTQEIKTKDLYEGAMYLCYNFELKTIKVLKENGKVTCELIFTGEEIDKKQFDYFNSTALVNVVDFRKSFGRLKSLVYAERQKQSDHLQSKWSDKGGNQ